MLVKLIRLGRDSELRTTQSGKQVLNFAGAYDVGYGDNKKTQWIDCALWGERGASVVNHLKKGSQIVVYANDVELEEYDKKDGTKGAKIKCRVMQFDFAGGNSQQATPQARQPIQQPTQQPPVQQPPSGSFDNFDDDIPFSNYEYKYI